MRTLIRRRFTAAAVAAVTTAALAACGSITDSADKGADDKVSKLQFIVPADAGGGWDTTARVVADTLKSEKLYDNASVENVPGAGGTIGLGQLVSEKNPDTLMMMGLVMVGAIETNKSQVTLSDTTPIAKLTEEAEVIVVPAKSSYKTINDLVKAMAADDKPVPVAGGSAGGIDHILAGLLLKASGVEGADIPKKLKYVPFSGGGESLGSLLGNKVAAGVSGVGEYLEHIESGKLRALAVSSPERVASLPDTPTLQESGIDLTLTNWRGVVAPGDISDTKAKALTDLVTELHDSAGWKAALKENDWTDAFVTGDEFASLIEDETETVRATLKEIGLVE